MRQVEMRIRVGAVLAALLVLVSCGDDEPPGADHEIKIRAMDFFGNDLSIRPGETVEWVNTLARPDTRTVTSGRPTDDVSTHGLLFDETLLGHKDGEAFGQRFTFKFEDPGEYVYFTRLPGDNQFTGIIRVQ